MVNGFIDELCVYCLIDENDEYVGVFGDNGDENVNKKGGKRLWVLKWCKIYIWVYMVLLLEILFV